MCVSAGIFLQHLLFLSFETPIMCQLWLLGTWSYVKPEINRKYQNVSIFFYFRKIKLQNMQLENCQLFFAYSSLSFFSIAVCLRQITNLMDYENGTIFRLLRLFSLFHGHLFFFNIRSVNEFDFFIRKIGNY